MTHLEESLPLALLPAYNAHMVPGSAIGVLWPCSDKDGGGVEI